MGVGVSQRQAEAEQLYEWCILVLEILTSGGPRTRLDIALDEFKRGLADACRRQNLKGLRDTRRDLLDWVILGGPEVRGTVDRALKGKFGEGLPAAYRMQVAEVKAIAKRGHIESDDEFRELEAWVERTSGTSKRAAQMRSVSKMLENYARERPKKGSTD